MWTKHVSSLSEFQGFIFVDQCLLGFGIEMIVKLCLILLAQVSVSITLECGQKLDSGWPWQAAIYKVSKMELEFKCGAILIDEMAVLLNSNCTENQKPGNLIVQLGKKDLWKFSKNPEVQYRKVDRIIGHSSGFSIIILKENVNYSNNLSPACLWNLNNLKLNENEVGKAVGWGIYEKYKEKSGDLNEISFNLAYEDNNSSAFVVKSKKSKFRHELV